MDFFGQVSLNISLISISRRLQRKKTPNGSDLETLNFKSILDLRLKCLLTDNSYAFSENLMKLYANSFIK